jgi:hypothetical protein
VTVEKHDPPDYQRYEFLKRERVNPGATPKEYQATIRALAKERGA